MSFLSHLECGNCSTQWEADRLQSRCTECSGPLLVRYRLADPGIASLEEVLSRPVGQFRFPEVLPTAAGAETPTLGEGATPLVPTKAIGAAVWVKDESQNPTGSFKARGMAVAVARNAELGATAIHLPSNGNAGAAAAAYGALHRVPVTVAVPANTPEALVSMARLCGAEVIRVDGTIADAASSLADIEGFSVATLAEPYRVEGKKMMGYEIFWDLGRLPDAIFYPTGGGTGLVGMAKAFDEMEALGWIGSERPSLVAVQVTECAPIVRAFHAGADHADPWEGPGETMAYGLRVPSAIGDRLMLTALRSSGGTAVAVSEAEMEAGTFRLASRAGIPGSPEGGACVAAYEKLVAEGRLSPDDEVVLFNTGAAANYR